MLDNLLSLGLVNIADPVNKSHPLNRGRVAWWLTLPSISGGKTWFDLMGRNHGTLTNITTSGSGWRGATRSGGFGQLRYLASNHAVTIPSTTVTSNVLSVAAWVSPTTLSDYYAIFSYYENDQDSFEIFFSPGSSLFAGAWTYKATALVDVSSAANTWFRLVATSNGTTVKLYVNGTEDPARRGTTSFTTLTSPATLGSRNGSFGLSGDLDDVSVWNRALSDAEVVADLDLSRRSYPGVLNRYWPSTMTLVPPAPVSSNLLPFIDRMSLDCFASLGL